MSNDSSDLLKRRQEAEKMALAIFPLPKNPYKNTLTLKEKKQDFGYFYPLWNSTSTGLVTRGRTGY